VLAIRPGYLQMRYKYFKIYANDCTAIDILF
jgi:hypothetical protein